MMIGRNHPCPCGSGKKYKKCHGALDHRPAAAPEAARADTLKAADVKLSDRLMRFARMRYGPHWLQDVFDSEGLVASKLSDSEMPVVIPWLQHFRANAAGVTLAEEWSRLERHLSPNEHVLLEAYDHAWVSLWEVAEVERGVGSRLTDVLTHEERFVHDVRSSNTLRRFDTLLAIILTCDGVSFFGGAHSQPLPPSFAETVVREARRLCRVRTRPVSPEKLRDPDMQLELIALWHVVVQDMLDQPPPGMQNTDGDPFVLTKDDFSLVASFNEVTERLTSLAGVQEPEVEGNNTVFVVTKTGNAMHRSWDNTIIGRIVLSGTRLTVETNSTRRADSLRSAVETHLQGLVRFRVRKEENTSMLMAATEQAAATRKDHADKSVRLEAVAALRQFRERHMRDWLDDAVPALDGLTPREAARLPRARPKLEALLKEFEQNEAHQPEPLRIDLRFLRDQLGISLGPCSAK